MRDVPAVEHYSVPKIFFEKIIIARKLLYLNRIRDNLYDVTCNSQSFANVYALFKDNTR